MLWRQRQDVWGFGFLGACLKGIELKAQRRGIWAIPKTLNPSRRFGFGVGGTVETSQTWAVLCD